MSNAKWTINQYHAAACITTTEINRKMKKVYDSTSDFPKSWKAKDPRMEHGKPRPRWQVDASSIGAPSVSFATDISNGVNLMTTVKAGDFSHTTIGYDDDGNPKIVHEKIDLAGLAFSLQTKVTGIEHKASDDLPTVDQYFTVQALYADLDNPELISNVASGYEMTDKGIDALTNVASTKVSADIVALVKGSAIMNKPYPSADAFWHALEKALGSNAAKVQGDKSKIVQAAHLAFAGADDTYRSVAQVLLDMCKSKDYKNKYVFGQSKIPKVTHTTGPFTPRAVRFSRFQDANDTTIGSLNWNLMVSADQSDVALPDLAQHANAGSFDSNPIPTGVPGVMLLSYGKVIEDLILPNGFKSLGLTGAKFASDPDNCLAKLNEDVALDASNLDFVKKGTFKAGDTVIEPDPDNNRIKVSFKISDMEWDKKWWEYINPNVVSLIHGLVDPPKYQASWSGYITFSLDNASQKLKASYSQDDPKVEYQERNTAWRVIDDISTAGVNELNKMAQLSVVSAELDNFVASVGGKVLNNVLNSVMLPGDAVFVFSAADFVDLGVRVHLSYE